MEFEALEDEASAIHGDLWEQLNAGGQVNIHTVMSHCSTSAVWELELVFRLPYNWPYR